MLALANAGPDCGPSGRPLKVIVQNKIKRPVFWYINVSLAAKLKMFHFYNFLFTFNQAIKHYLILKKKINHTKPNYIFLTFFLFPSETLHVLLKIYI